MRYSFSGLRASEIERYFPRCIPCNCWNDDDAIYKIPRYSVDVSYGSTMYGNGSRLIKEIRVECDCCGRAERYDVEREDVYSSELSW